MFRSRRCFQARTVEVALQFGARALRSGRGALRCTSPRRNCGQQASRMWLAVAPERLDEPRKVGHAATSLPVSSSGGSSSSAASPSGAGALSKLLALHFGGTSCVLKWGPLRCLRRESPRVWRNLGDPSASNVTGRHARLGKLVGTAQSGRARRGHRVLAASAATCAAGRAAAPPGPPAALGSVYCGDAARLHVISGRKELIQLASEMASTLL